MYNKSKNKVLFAVFILIILLIVFILVLSVYNTKENKNVEEYKISLNNAIYDKEFSYIFLKNDAVLKREWDGNYYLYENSNSKKYELGTEPVLYDKSKNQVTLYGTVYQIYENGETVQKTEKTVINDLSNFQFFKLSDRKYLVVGNNIKSENFSTVNYLIVSIDKAGNATLLNNDVNIKTINPLILSVDDIMFDIANEKLIIEEKEVDLKKINGSTNEYVEKEEEEKPSNNNGGTSNNNSNNQNSNNNSNNTSSNSQIYNQIISQIINISGLVSSNTNKTNLYKNISLRSISVGASYLDVTYSIIDPQDKYLSVFLALEDENENISFYHLNKDSTGYRISGLSPNKQYKLSMNYIVSGNSSSVVADSIVALTSTDPTSVRITQLSKSTLSYKIKMYNEYEFLSGNVVLTNCEDSGYLGIRDLNVANALSNAGDIGEFILDQEYPYEYVCLSLTSVKDANGNDITVNSYHKVKIN